MSGLFGIGGSAAKTDRQHQLGSWGELASIFNATAKPGAAQTKTGTQNLATSADYWKALLSGDPSKMSAALAPQISAIQGQTGQRVSTIGQFSGRSGGTASAQIGLESEAARSIQNLFDLLGPEAAQELAAVGGTQEALGTEQQGLAETAASSLASATGNARPGDVAQQQQQQSAIIGAIAGLAGI